MLGRRKQMTVIEGLHPWIPNQMDRVKSKERKREEAAEENKFQTAGRNPHIRLDFRLRLLNFMGLDMQLNCHPVLQWLCWHKDVTCFLFEIWIEWQKDREGKGGWRGIGREESKLSVCRWDDLEVHEGTARGIGTSCGWLFSSPKKKKEKKTYWHWGWNLISHRRDGRWEKQ